MYEMGIGMNGKGVHMDEFYSTNDKIYEILKKYYLRLYGESFLASMASRITLDLESGAMMTRGDVRFFIHWNTSGGGVADMSSADIQAALPTKVQDTDRRSYKGRIE